MDKVDEEVLEAGYFYEIPSYCEVEKTPFKLKMDFEGKVSLVLGYELESNIVTIPEIEVIIEGFLDPDVGPFNIDSKGGCDYFFNFRNDNDFPTTLKFSSDEVGVILLRVEGLMLEEIVVEQEGSGVTEMVLEPGEERHYFVRIS